METEIIEQKWIIDIQQKNKKKKKRNLNTVLTSVRASGQKYNKVKPQPRLIASPRQVKTQGAILEGTYLMSHVQNL